MPLKQNIHYLFLMSLLPVEGIIHLPCSAVVYLLLYKRFSTIFYMEWTAAYCTKIFEKIHSSFNKGALFIKFITTFTLVFGHFQVQIYTSENTWKQPFQELKRLNLKISQPCQRVCHPRSLNKLVIRIQWLKGLWT